MKTTITWISVDQRKPERFSNVMVLYSGGAVWIGHWNGLRWSSISGNETQDITHWAFIPAVRKITPRMHPAKIVQTLTEIITA